MEGIKKRGDVWDAWLRMGDRMVWKRGAKSLAEAKAWRLQKLKEREGNVQPLAARITVVELIRQHIELYGGGWKASTRVKHEDVLARYIASDPIGRRPAAKLTPDEVQAFVNRVVERSSPAMAEKVVALVRLVYRKAKRTRKVAYVPTEEVVIPKHRFEKDVPSPAETEALIAAVRSDYRNAVELLSLTGLRRGELVALRWIAVNPFDGTLRVDATGQYLRGEYVEDVPKTEAGRRTIVLLADAVALLDRVRREQLERKRELGGVWHDLGYVFDRGDGRPLDPSELSRAVTEASRRLGRRFRCHDLRHAFVTRAVEARVPAAIVARAVGHVDPAFTQKVYFDPHIEHQRLLAAALDEARAGRDSNVIAATHEAVGSGAPRPIAVTSAGESE